MLGRIAPPHRFALAVLPFALLLLFSAARSPDEPRKGRFEYYHSEVQTTSIVTTLDGLDAEGWEIVQLVPIWELRQANEVNSLAPTMYQVFAKRPRAAAAK
jgi:hypothetical protein